MRLPVIQRRAARSVRLTNRVGPAGAVVIGGDAPVSVQSMTNTRTADAEATVAQIEELAAAGADVVRVAVPTPADTAALPAILARASVPIVADVHFHFDRALEAIDAGVAKIRLNPGNIRDREQVRRVIARAAEAGVAIRVGVNEGSIVDRSDAARHEAELQRPLHELMVEKLATYLEAFEEAKFENLVLSAKSHDAVTCIEVNRLMARRWDYPLHLGVTHAGTPASGAIRSAAALGTLLAEGIGETLRISYAGDPVREVEAAVELLASLRLRKRRGIELIACPTCGRIQMDMAPVAEAIRAALSDVVEPVTVAVMGCVVNGPGEAEGADVAVCAGKGKALLYRRGHKVRTLKADEIVPAVVAEVRQAAAEMRTSEE